MDLAVDPCDDFYRYACGGYLARAEIPPDRASVGRLDAFDDARQERLRAVLERPAAAGTDAGKAHEYYQACLDESVVEAQGVRPLAPYFARIAAIHDDVSLIRAVAWFHRRGVPMLFELRVRPDGDDAVQPILVLGPAKLTLPDRSYYPRERSPMVAPALHDVKLPAHVERMADLLGVARGKRREWLSAGIEDALARASTPPAELRDAQAVTRSMTLAELQRLSGFAWDEYFRELGVSPARVDVVSLPYFQALAGYLGKWPDLLSYLRWEVVHHFASRLPRRLVDEDFAFRGLLDGRSANLPRSARCVQEVSAAMSGALAPALAKDTPAPEGPREVEGLAAAIEGTLRSRIEEVAWLDSASRQAARAKIAKLQTEVASPGTGPSYAPLPITPHRYFEDAAEAERFEVDRQLATVGKPPDWKTSPAPAADVDATYRPSSNRMTFAAASLRPPLFARTVPPWINFGAIGVVVAHELTHGFDAEGRKLDGEGNLRPWWTPASAVAFEQRAACVQSQYDAYTVLGGVHLDGKLELAENVADLGGVKLAFTAMEASMPSRPGRAADTESGHSKEQAFFVAYGQLRCGKVTAELLRSSAATSDHAPPEYRVDGPLSNLAPFAAAFHCGEGSAMVRAAPDRCEVW